jgi:phosphoribosylamine-glycine ligase
MQTINITAYTEDASQIEAVKAFMKALKIKFEISQEKPYNPEFVAKIEKSKQEFKDGKSIRVKKEDLQSFLGLL